MYINFNILKSRNLSVRDIILIQMAKQAKNEDLSETIENNYAIADGTVERLVERGYIHFIKGKQKETLYKKLRTTKKGTDLLSDIETPDVSDEDIIIFNWMADFYKKLEKKLGNMKRTKRHIAAFRVQSGIEKNNLVKLLKAFVNDEINMDYNHILEYAFFKPTNIFDVRFDLGQSRLYQYFLDNEEKFKKIFQDFE